MELSVCHLVESLKVTLLLRIAVLIIMEIATVSFTYITFIFGVDISSLVNEECHCVNIVSVGCHMQGSPLMERNNINCHELVYS